jgi:pyrimidine-nucleoside phosphorylase
LTGHAESSERILAAIEAKRAGAEHGSELLKSIVDDFVAQRVPDYQMASWLATVACRGMSRAETAAITRAYAASGRQLRLGAGALPVVDKHSTGGVGDKVSLVVGPMVAACGVAVAKISGRGLGFAGGTLDKLESVPGLRMSLSTEEFREVLGAAGMVIAGQSPDLVPGDRATYGLRDVTGTVEVLPLVAASVMSKKIALGTDGVVLDVKYGEGALMRALDDAVELAGLMRDIALDCDLPCRVVLSSMNQPLGRAIGNALEVREAIDVLHGAEVPGISELSRVVGRLMLQLAEPDLGDDEALDRLSEAISSGAAFERLRRWVGVQGGDVAVLDKPDLLPSAARVLSVCATESGYVQRVSARDLGHAALRLGAGRLVYQGALDHAAGIVVHRRIGDVVSAGDVLAELHCAVQSPSDITDVVRDAFTVGSVPVGTEPVIREVW